jgi:hypothetical protein
MLQVYNKYGQLKVVSSTSSTGVSSVSGVSPITSTGGSNPIISTLVTHNRLLGRYSASNGPMQEILIGTGLSLVGNTLNSTSVVVANALTRTNDTNVTLTLGGTPATALLQNVSLTLGWTGTLADGRITSSGNWNTAYTNRITSLTTTGTSGAATLIANTLNIPQYQPAGTYVTSVTGTSPIVSSGGTSPAISIPLGTSSVDGYLSATDRTNFQTAYTNRITSLTTTGSGAATLISNVLNIPTPPSATFTSLTTTGSSGSSTLLSGVLNVPTYTLSGLGGQPLATNLTSLSGLTYASTSFVKMTAAGTFTLDTNTYLTSAVTSVGATGPITSSGGNTPTISTSMATNKLIGRSTAGTGVMEEITIGTGLTLSGGTLNGSATGVTSVGLTMPSAFIVANSPITSSGDIAVTGAGLVSQYIRGDGTLANFPTSTGGGSSVNYYLNGSVSQGTFGGTTYYQMSKTPILGAGTNFTRTNGAGNGYIASFITDAGDPSFLNIPGGNWNLEFYFQSSSTGGSPQFYGEIYKVSATNVFTLVASGSANPEGITNGTTVDQYFTSVSVPQTSLLVTDRLAVRIYVITSGRTITLHTENGNLCEVLTTFSTGITALNGLTTQVQNLAVGTSGTDFAISSSTDTHTFNLPTASASNRGALSSTDWTTFNNKQNASTRRNANNSSNNNINYCGVALGTGVSESSAVWTITRLTIAASGSITTATATNVAWTNRQSATYT